MGKLIQWNTLSLDGYFEARGAGMWSGFSRIFGMNCENSR